MSTIELLDELLDSFSKCGDDASHNEGPFL